MIQVHEFKLEYCFETLKTIYAKATKNLISTIFFFNDHLNVQFSILNSLKKLTHPSWSAKVTLAKLANKHDMVSKDPHLAA